MPVSAKNARRLEIMQAGNADIWVLTETRDELDLGPGYTAVSSTPRHRTVRYVPMGDIWSRFPLLTPVEVRDTSRTVAGLYKSPLGPLLVYGTVMPWHTQGCLRYENWGEARASRPRAGGGMARPASAPPGPHSASRAILNMNLGGPHYYGTKEGRRLLHSGMEPAALDLCDQDRAHPPWAARQTAHRSCPAYLCVGTRDSRRRRVARND